MPLLAFLLALAAFPAYAIEAVPTPEPASLSLLAVAVGGIAIAKFRRRK